MPEGPNRDFKGFIEGIGQRLEFERGLAKLTVNELAAKSSVDRSTIRAIEQGKRNPSLFVLWEIAQALRIDFRDLIPPLWIEVRGPKAIKAQQDRSGDDIVGPAHRAGETP